MHGLRRGGDQRARRGVALGDPGSFVQQAGRLVERLDIDFLDVGAEPRQAIQRIGIIGGRTLVAEEDPLARARHADADMGGQRARPGQRPPPAERVPRVISGNDGEHRRSIVGGEREHRYAVERAACRHQAGRGDEAEARLEADDVVEHGRHAARSRGVGAERHRDEAGRDRDPGTRARPAGDQRGIERIARCSIGGTGADEPGRELVEIGLADDDGAGQAQPGDRGRVPARTIGKCRAGGGGRQAEGVDIVLHPDRNAVQRQAGLAPLGELAGLRQRVALLAQRDEHRRIVQGPDPRIAARDDLRRVGRAGAVGGQYLCNGLGQYALCVAGFDLHRYTGTPTGSIITSLIITPLIIRFQMPNAGRIAAAGVAKVSKRRSDQSCGSSFTIEAP